MRVALVNYRYFVSGGPERYMFNIKEVLEQHGHEVVPFSIKSSKNEPSPLEAEFLDTVDDQTYFAQSKKTLRVVLKSFTRMFYSFEAKKVFAAFLDKHKPDLVYIIHFHNKISPSIIDAAKSRKIPVIHRISDFQYMCPNALFYNEKKGICEDCLNGHSLTCIKNKCVMNSRVYSAIKLAAKKLHDFLHVTKKVDAFVVPSLFTLQKLNRYGIPMEKLHHIPTFFNLKNDEVDVSYEPYFLFVGRLEKQKGLMTLLKAFVKTQIPLKIIGFSNDGYEDELKAFLAGKDHRIEFLGRKSFEEIEPYLKSCLCTLVPSEWYDNFPNVILESFAYKKAVVATDIGSLPELVVNGETGCLFKYGDADDLADKTEKILKGEMSAEEMGAKAFAVLKDKYVPDAHYAQLIALFEGMKN
ncbi:MAG: glycosyltransferase family 4 protein [Fibrobacter sp.]|uniref:glycosyltransferase family 4 protein n=1 Tax=Fibrobacter sp. TaxID=35828 RepID=UPI0025BEF596|nr:glycosyltransferase family 4 protein [Fibrobacter sp.]MBR3852539.1 glycosyltransferase family 4 protein [Fibrobacter sp.]